HLPNRAAMNDGGERDAVRELEQQFVILNVHRCECDFSARVQCVVTDAESSVNEFFHGHRRLRKTVARGTAFAIKLRSIGRPLVLFPQGGLCPTAPTMTTCLNWWSCDGCACTAITYDATCDYDC